MALYDIKEFLTLDDVAEYLADKCDYDFNLERSIDQNRLIETIIQFVRNDELHPVFYYSGDVDWLDKTVLTSKSGNSTKHEIVSTGITYNMSRSGHYFVNDKTFDKLIENNCSHYINIINCTVEPYHVDGKQEIVENSILSYRKIKEGLSITFHDLLYPKLDLDKLFNQTEADADVIKKLREQVADLTAEQARTKANETTEGDKPLIKLGEYQRLLITYPLFTAHQIACLLSDSNPVARDYDNNDGYRLYRDMTDAAVDARLLTVFNDKGSIPSEQVKVWLARRNFIYEGFNDDVVEYLDDEGDPLKRSSDEFAGIIGVVYEMVHKLDAEVEQLSEEYEELRLEYKELEAKNEKLVEELKQVRSSARSTKAYEDNQVKGTVQKNHLITIGLLLELLTRSNGYDGKYGVGLEPKKPLFSSEAKIIEEIGSYAIPGQTRGSVAPRFKSGKDALKESTDELDLQVRDGLQECFDCANEALIEAEKEKNSKPLVKNIQKK